MNQVFVLEITLRNVVYIEYNKYYIYFYKYRLSEICNKEILSMKVISNSQMEDVIEAKTFLRK